MEKSNNAEPNIYNQIALVKFRADKKAETVAGYKLSIRISEYTYKRFQNFCMKSSEKKGAILAALVEYGLDHFEKIDKTEKAE